jgi:hypothetical protein
MTSMPVVIPNRHVDDRPDARTQPLSHSAH